MKNARQIRFSTLLVALIVLTMSACGSTGAKPTAEQERKFAFGAVLAARNPVDYNSLSGMKDITKDAFIAVLEESWDIVDHNTAIETLDFLREEGHRLSLDPDYYGYDEIFDIITLRDDDPEALEELDAEKVAYDVACAALTGYGFTASEIAAVDTMSAWDYDRAVTVARWCYGVGYLTEEEMWVYIDWAVEQGTKDYDSWRSYFMGVMFGRAIWSEEDTFTDSNKNVTDALINNKNSIYNRVSFAG